ncbi:hypothetical protein B0H16DRAFT_227187 [Mycena metata]|uniref:Uncharacterized protein n=1 Tax=Mycena metata TaxID=1033252 RepID=A0AAD7HVQ4_9AGAR|nr:hypothetical protein B0H16DRAFT_227187 [Mycena metata]
MMAPAPPSMFTPLYVPLVACKLRVGGVESETGDRRYRDNAKRWRRTLKTWRSSSRTFSADLESVRSWYSIIWAEAEEHKRQRKALSPAFSNAAICKLTSVFQDSTHKVKSTSEDLIDSPESGIIDVQTSLSPIIPLFGLLKIHITG